MTGEPTHTATKEMAPRTPATDYRCLKSEVPITLRCQLCSTRYTALRVKNCSKSTSAIKVATIKNIDDFRYKGKPSRATAKSTPFAVSQDEWDKKEDTGESMKNAFNPIVRTVVFQKTLLRPKRHELRLSEGINQSGSRKIPFKKIRSNLLKTFRVDLKACLGLVLPNQYCLIIVREN